MTTPDRSHDPVRASWIRSANAPGADFPLQNLPFGVFSRDAEAPHVGVAIGDAVLDLAALEAAGLLTAGPHGLGSDRPAFGRPGLEDFMARGPKAWSAVRAALGDLLDAAGDPRLRDDPILAGRAILPAADARLHMPFAVAGFTDFYASRHHAEAVGTIFRGPQNALPPNWLHMPIGYNGRPSTVVVSGTPVRRPLGQLKGPDDPAPRFGPSARLDIEIELGAVVGAPSEMGRPITTAEARAMIFGYVLLNDWSARDIQTWEYQPLGPFQSKAFATSISPWVVTAAALDPFRVDGPPPERPLLPYLVEPEPRLLDIAIEAALTPEGRPPTVIAKTNARHLYYSAAQQLAHHAACGCAMRAGDLLGSGTISGPEPGSRGSLLELSWNGRDPIPVAGGTRTFLEDGDSVTLRGRCERAGFRGIGFGSVEGTILAAPDLPAAWA